MTNEKVYSGSVFTYIIEHELDDFTLDDLLKRVEEDKQTKFSRKDIIDTVHDMCDSEILGRYDGRYFLHQSTAFA